LGSLLGSLRFQPLNPLQVGLGVQDGQLAQGGCRRIAVQRVLGPVLYEPPNVVEEQSPLLRQEDRTLRRPHQREYQIAEEKRRASNLERDRLVEPRLEVALALLCQGEDALVWAILLLDTFAGDQLLVRELAQQGIELPRIQIGSPAKQLIGLTLEFIAIVRLLGQQPQNDVFEAHGDCLTLYLFTNNIDTCKV